MNDSHASEANTDSSIKNINERLDAEARIRELALVSQEHRLPHAAYNLVRSFTHPDIKTRAELKPKAAQAFFWCLVSRTATTGVGVIAILSLWLAFYQTRTISEQSSLMKAQIFLMEQQNQAALLPNNSEILAKIESEIPSHTSMCNKRTDTLCWDADGKFRPSLATSSRIAATTHMLPPRRIVLESPPRCSEAIFSEAVHALSAEINFERIYRTKPSKEQKTARLKNLAKAILESNSKDKNSITESLFESVSRELFTSKTTTLEQRISCKSMSPERGQLLVGLAAAEVNLTDLTAKGATFTNSAVAGIISSEALSNLDLSDSDLAAASFKGPLQNVRLSYSNLGTNTLDSSKISDVDLAGAELELDIASTLFGLGFMRNNSPENFISKLGFTLYNSRDRSDINSFLCKAIVGKTILELTGSADHKNTFEKEYLQTGILSETRKTTEGRYNSKGILVQGVLKDQLTIFTEPNTPEEAVISYFPMSDCNSLLEMDKVILTPGPSKSKIQDPT
ncbi:hypothetical protein QYE80_13405 [Pseudomonas tohonis]|uniref:pentapeptide repeat-containing protein n=1 Tax=Pseudomonas sp. zfem005 TaxID=3078200 RepID=UPI00041CDF47|nr:hypothetical protein [Pseudomonas sp. zfem005]MDN4145986.1 hypothetical protein [Pseudomonas tohonis]MDU9415320.1 hypothetical protein [Pseudomonas sp. zfem005]